MRALVLVLLAACADAPLPPDPYADGTNPQVPPRDAAGATAWLAAGHYLGWACEAAPHEARPPSAHAMNRVCSNDLLVAGPVGDAYPVDAVSVKELWRSGVVVGHAVARKVRADAGGDHWYWYEKLGEAIKADEVGREGCQNCHDRAPRDQVFTRVQP